MKELPPAHSDDEIRELAREFVAGRVVSQMDVPPNLWHMVFLPFFIGGAGYGYTDEQLDEIILFGIPGQHATTGMAINGYPAFVEMVVWRREDFSRAVDWAQRMNRAMNVTEAD